MDRSDQDLQWPLVREAIAGFALSALGKRLALELDPAPDQSAAELRQSVVVEALALSDAGFPIPAGEFTEQSDMLLRVERGASAAGTELAQLRTALRVALRLGRFGSAHAQSAPSIERLLDVDPELISLVRAIDATIDDAGLVLDEASPGLSQARREVRKVRDEIKSKMGQLLSRYREALQDGYFAERDGRYVLPVRTDAPFRVDGVVLGSSGSGSTLYVEPHELGALGNRLRLADGEVERQIAIVLAQLSEQLLPHCEEVRWALEVCGRADLLFAISCFAERTHSRVVPFDDAGEMHVRAARHPLLCLTLEHVVPSDLGLSAGQALILSGPNAGGKTVALKTLGLLALMQASGLPLPVAAESKVGFFDDVLCDIGDDQSLLMSLSTFSGHIERVVRVLEEAGHGTLVLFDELMGGTDPDEGAALAIATVEALVSAGASVCVTTHYEALKNHAQKHAHFHNGAVGFDFDKMEPTFLVTMGRPGASSALVVAERFGLASAITQRALTLMPQALATERNERIAVEQITARLENERAQLQVLRDEQADLNRRLERQLAKEEERQRSELLREGDALRLEIKAARAELRRVQQALKHAGRDELNQIQADLDRAARIDAVGGPLHQRAKNTAPIALAAPTAQIVPGCVVRVAGFSMLGEVLELPKKGSVRVLLGVMKMNVALTDISLPGPLAVAAPKQTSSRQQTHLAASPAAVAIVRSQDVTVDLRGQRVEDGLLLLDQFIEGLLHHHEPGGYVLHGHGTGAMKDAVRTHLRAHSCVHTSRPAERDEGGDAFTVFWLSI